MDKTDGTSSKNSKGHRSTLATRRVSSSYLIAGVESKMSCVGLGLGSVLVLVLTVLVPSLWYIYELSRSLYECECRTTLGHDNIYDSCSRIVDISDVVCPYCSRNTLVVNLVTIVVACEHAWFHACALCETETD